MDKLCGGCKELKPRSVDFFYRDITKSGGLSNRCKPCFEKRKIARRCKHRDSKKEGARKIARIHYSASEHTCKVIGCEQKAEHLHHVDYDRPLEVVPLCSKHHKGIHYCA